MSGPPEDGRVRFAWPDGSAPLARVLPVILRFGDVERVAAPGEPVRIPFTRFTAVAAVPGSAPLVAELDRSKGDVLTLPFPTEAVVAAVIGSEREHARGGTIAFGVDAWSAEPPGPTETDGLTFARRGDELCIASWTGEDRPSAPARLVVAARMTPTRRVAIPTLGPGETAVVDLAVERPFGDRPALLPSDPRTRLLLAYLGTGQHRIARVLAARLATVLAEQRPIAWSEPSFAQLLVGYAHAADDDWPALAAWCRRTRADRLLGVDGVVLAATAAWLQRRPWDAARLLLRAEQAGSAPVMSPGLELAVRLAYLLIAEGVEWEALGRLVTAYSVLSTRSDPLADTITTATSARRPVSLDGRGWLARARWALAYLAVRARLPHAVRSAAEAIYVVVDSSATSDARSSTSHRGGTVTKLSFFREMALAIVVAWLLVVATTVVVAVTDPGDWEGLVAPLGILGAAVFTLLGVAITDNRRDAQEREHELLERAQRSERRVREVEEEAMKGRALAAALQAESGPGASSDLARHAQLSRSLFGDLVGDNIAVERRQS